MNRVLGVALGILSAIGGFVDIGDLVFNLQAGASFGYALLWAPLVGVVGIVVFSEMCGRVAAVSGRAVFDAVRERAGVGLGLMTLVAAQVVNLMTCAAEIGGVAIVLQLLTALPYRLLLPLAVALLVIAVWTLRFAWIERLFSLPGLCLVVFAAAAVKLGPDWGAAAHGVVPHLPVSQPLVYAYFVVGLLGAAMTPYEVYFYSSGAVEDRWSLSELGLNRVTAVLGYGIGAFLSFALMIVAAEIFLPRGIEPATLGTAPLGAEVAFGTVGLLLALVGIFFAVGGAAVETCLSGAYSLAQFFGWEWGKYHRRREAPRFTLAWLVIFVLALGVALTGIDAVELTEYAVIFSVVALPLTYLPILLVAQDRSYMGEHVNGRVANAFGWLYLVIILVVALSAIPLMVLTNSGQG